MSEPFLGEIRIFGFNFAPQFWTTCDGQLLSISQNSALYALIGTTYGGDGVANFALPDLRGRTMLHMGTSHVIGEKSGLEQAGLGVANLPVHTHVLKGNTSPATVNTAQGNTLAASESSYPNYCDLSSQAALNASSLSTAGVGAAHNNMQPSLVVNFCIALSGLWPSRS